LYIHPLTLSWKSGKEIQTFSNKTEEFISIKPTQQEMEKEILWEEGKLYQSKTWIYIQRRKALEKGKMKVILCLKR
jgi:hypothetical protein